jgi:hypothetical protein
MARGPHCQPSPCCLLNLRQQNSPDASLQVLLSSFFHLRSPIEVDINWGWDLYTFSVAPSLIRSFPHALFASNYLLSFNVHALDHASQLKQRHTSSPTINLHSSTPTMTDVMAQQGYGLSVPNSRQDVVSALLNEYGTSFGRGDGPSALSPVPADKELPLPPRSDSLRNKPLPAIQRAEQRMSMKFQLRGKRSCLRFRS